MYSTEIGERAHKEKKVKVGNGLSNKVGYTHQILLHYSYLYDFGIGLQTLETQ